MYIMVIPDTRMKSIKFNQLNQIWGILKGFVTYSVTKYYVDLKYKFDNLNYLSVLGYWWGCVILVHRNYSTIPTDDNGYYVSDNAASW